MKDLCQKWKVKLIFGGAYRLSGTGIVERLEIINVGCNLKQFDDFDLTDPDPHILRHIYTFGPYGTGGVWASVITLSRALTVGNSE